MNKVPTERAKFWQQHVEAAKSFDGTAQQYCDKHELEPSSFYQWRKRLVGDTQKTGGAKFLPVVISKSEQFASRTAPLPNAQWVAEVMLHLIRGLA
jgi:hypothetical protein